MFWGIPRYNLHMFMSSICVGGLAVTIAYKRGNIWLITGQRAVRPLLNTL